MFHEELVFDWNQATDDIKLSVSKIQTSFVGRFSKAVLKTNS